MQIINFTAYTNDTSQIEAIKAFMKALKIKFEVSKSKPYSHEFTEKLKESQQQFKNGKCSTITLDDIWKKD
ncbi:MAG: hypothetical protein KKD31_17230 [Bacteroidetes bacterium]|nr:hypothetical protein [Bacteroidota bacterium]